MHANRAVNRAPLCQVLCVQNVPTGAVTLEDLTVTPVEQPRTSARFDLVLNVNDAAPAVTVALDYATELFSAEMIRRFLYVMGDHPRSSRPLS